MTPWVRNGPTAGPHGPYLTHESRVIVLGLPRYGKTRLIRDTLTADSARVIYHDITGHDYYARGRLPLSVNELADNADLLTQEHMRLVVIAETPGDPEAIKEECAKLIELVYESGGNCVLVFDELQAHQRKTEKLLNGLFARGSHHGIATVLASQKATDIGLGARTTASDCYCFGQHHPVELKVLYDCYGDVFAARASQLRRGDKPIHWREQERERWWSANARNKYSAAISPQMEG